MTRENNIPGLRQPTAQEKNWIAQGWSNENQKVRGAGLSKVLRMAGIFLIAVGVVTAVRGAESASTLLVLAVMGAICLTLSSVAIRSNRMMANRWKALREGNYLVAPAFSARIWSGSGHATPTAHADVVLPDGRAIGACPIPRGVARPLLQQNIHRVPLLLIVIEGDESVLAIPQM